MICPYCGTNDQFMTVDTRSREWGMKRIKKCLKCGEKFATIEVCEITEEAKDSLRKSKKIREYKRRKEK